MREEICREEDPGERERVNFIKRVDQYNDTKIRRANIESCTTNAEGHKVKATTIRVMQRAKRMKLGLCRMTQGPIR